MARARLIKPGFFTDERLLSIDPLGRLLFAGLWCHADREGRLKDNALKFKIEILPLDNCDVEVYLVALADRGLIVRYTVGDVRYIQIATFTLHQSPHMREPDSTIPPPDGYPASTRQEQDAKRASKRQARGQHSASTGRAPGQHEADPVPTPGQHAASTVLAPVEPSGSGSGSGSGNTDTNVSGTLRDRFISRYKTASNKLAVIGECFEQLLGSKPNYERLGAMSKRLNSGGKLIGLIFEASRQTIADDPHDYLDRLVSRDLKRGDVPIRFPTQADHNSARRGKVVL